MVVSIAEFGMRLAGVVAFPLLTAIALYRGGLAAGLSRRTSVTVAVGAAAVWGAWIGVSTALAAAGVYRDPGPVPWFGVAILGALLAALLATRIPVVARILAAPGSANRLVWPQAVRILGVTWLIALAQGTLPAAFALPAGLGDIATGVSALLLIRRWRTSSAVWLNVFGLVELLIALTIGYLGGASAQTVLPLTPSTIAVTVLPVALNPTTVVSLALALHIVSLARLRTATRPAATPAPA